jgi:hypothetical protein
LAELAISYLDSTIPFLANGGCLQKLLYFLSEIIAVIDFYIEILVTINLRSMSKKLRWKINKSIYFAIPNSSIVTSVNVKRNSKSTVANIYGDAVIFFLNTQKVYASL